MKDKLRYIFLPFLLVMVGLVVGYSFLHWLLLIKFRLFSIREDLVNIILPMILAGLFALVMIRRKAKALRLKTSRGSWIDLYTVIAALLILWPLVTAQELLVSATGKLTSLGSVSRIQSVPWTKYYAFRDGYAFKGGASTHTEFSTSGKYNSEFNMILYVAVPVFNSAADTTSGEPLCWLGLRYLKTISNSKSDQEKESEYGAFADASIDAFNAKDLSYFLYYERLDEGNGMKDYVTAARRVERYKKVDMILVGKEEPFENRNGQKIPWLIGTLIGGPLLWLLLVLVPKTNERQMEVLKSGRPDMVAVKDRNETLALFTPHEGFYITPLIMYANIGVFLAMMVAGLGFISFHGDDLVRWGANYGPMTKDGQWWRLLTSTFLHGGLMHLLANMYGLMFVGIFLEPVMGKWKYLALYLGTGILASLTSLWWHDQTVSVGASGAIFGLYGVFLALLQRKIFPPEMSKAFMMSTLIFVGFNLLMGLTGGIDNAAHIGGLISGFLLGFFVHPQNSMEEE